MDGRQLYPKARVASTQRAADQETDYLNLELSTPSLTIMELWLSFKARGEVPALPGPLDSRQRQGLLLAVFLALVVFLWRHQLNHRLEGAGPSLLPAKFSAHLIHSLIPSTQELEGARIETILKEIVSCPLRPRSGRHVAAVSLPAGGSAH